MSIATRDRVRHACLRDGERWSDVVLDGLQVAADGTIELRRVPSLTPPLQRQVEPVGPSGIAIDRDCGLYIVDSSLLRVSRIGLDCQERRELDLGRWGIAPTSIAVSPLGWVLIADELAARVLVLTPDLDVRDIWTAGLLRPVAVAASADAVYVLDASTGVVRLDLFGAPLALVAIGDLTPRSICTGPDDSLYVADQSGRGTFRFAPTGVRVGPPLAVGVSPQALAATREHLFLADQSTGEILVASLTDGTIVGRVDAFRGPVSALAVDTAGCLYIKPGPDDEYFVAYPDAASVTAGRLTTGVLDAGIESTWFRAVVEASVPPSGSVRLEVSVVPPESAPSWTAVATLDSPLPPSRYLSMRVSVACASDGRTPSLRQIRAETPGDSYYDYLPAAYSRESSRTALVDWLLDLAKAELGDLEGSIRSLPGHFTASSASLDGLRRLADWMALPRPTLQMFDERANLAALIAEIPELYDTRGTLAGIRRLVEIYAGASPSIFEDFASRGIWSLGIVSALGFDTMLPETAVDGFVVDEANVGMSGPEKAAKWGSALFAGAAHRFTVVVPRAAAPSDEARRLVEKTIDDEKPAHTDCHICYVGPGLRIGVQARAGLDAIVGGAADMTLDERSRLDLDARVSGDDGDGPGAVGRRGRLSVDTRLG